MNIRETKRRDKILNGNILGVLVYISLPIFIFTFFQSLYTFFDTFIVSKINNSDSGNSVTAVIYFDQVKALISSFGSGLAVGGSVYVARHYGSNNIEKAKKTANCIYFLMLLVNIATILIFIPFAKPFLSLMGTPKDIVSSGLGYFRIHVVNLCITIMNAVYIGIERAKGNTKTILALNIVSMIVKISLTSLFVLVFHLGLNSIAVATLISQLVLFAIALLILTRKNNALRITNPFKSKLFTKEILKPIFIVSLPIFFGKFMFSLGKTAISTISSRLFDTSSVIGALGIASIIGSFAQLASSAFEETLPSIVSQNLGNNNTRRAFRTTLIAFTIGFAFTATVIVIQSLMLDFFVGIFSNSTDQAFMALIKTLYKWERFSAITTGIGGILIGCLYGFGSTRISTYSNFARLFVLRIPILLVLYYFFDVGPEAVGIAMFLSNFVVSILIVVYFLYFYRKINKYGYTNNA